jgi:hypothetical protein
MALQPFITTNIIFYINMKYNYVLLQLVYVLSQLVMLLMLNLVAGSSSHTSQPESYFDMTNLDYCHEQHDRLPHPSSG